MTPVSYALNPGRIAAAAEAEPETALTICSPQTTGLFGGRFCAGMRQDHEFATDQRDDDGGALVFDSPVLETRVEILGAPVVELEIASDRPRALIALRLSDLHPDGAATRVTYGVLNLSHRDGHEQPAPLEPGARFRVRVQLNDIAYAFPPGHRIRLAVSTAYWPLVWPPPEPVTLTLYTGASRLELPVRPLRAETAPVFEEPEGAPPLACTELEPESCSRTITRDFGNGGGNGGVTLRTDDDNGLKRIEAHGLETGSRVVESFTITPEDPLTARAEAAWTFRIGRGDWQTRTEGRTVMWSDRDNFYLEARLEAFEGETRVFEKTWNETIPRDLV